MPIIRIPSALRSYVKEQGEVVVRGETIREVMEDLVYQFPSFKQHIYKDEGNLRDYVHLFVSSRDIRYLDGMDTKLGENEIVNLVPSIAGG